MTPTYHFEWDPRKAASNLRKHGIDFEQAATIFLDPLQLTLFDETHSEQDEERWITLGRAENGTLLVAVHTYRDINEREALVRLISARPATKREQQTYEAGV